MGHELTAFILAILQSNIPGEQEYRGKGVPIALTVTAPYLKASVPR